MELVSLFGACCFLPESPKFLIMQCRFTEARVVMNQISTFNGQGSFTFSEEDFKVFSNNSVSHLVLQLTSNSSVHAPSAQEVEELIKHVCKHTTLDDTQLWQVQIREQDKGTLTVNVDQKGSVTADLYFSQKQHSTSFSKKADMLEQNGCIVSIETQNFDQKLDETVEGEQNTHENPPIMFYLR